MDNKITDKETVKVMVMVSKIKLTFKQHIKIDSVVNQIKGTNMTFICMYNNRNSKFVLKLKNHGLKETKTQIQQP